MPAICSSLTGQLVAARPPRRSGRASSGGRPSSQCPDIDARHRCRDQCQNPHPSLANTSTARPPGLVHRDHTPHSSGTSIRDDTSQYIKLKLALLLSPSAACTSSGKRHRTSADAQNLVFAVLMTGSLLPGPTREPAPMRLTTITIEPPRALRNMPDDCRQSARCGGNWRTLMDRRFDAVLIMGEGHHDSANSVASP
jgi:hypothetical protein